MPHAKEAKIPNNKYALKLNLFNLIRYLIKNIIELSILKDMQNSSV